jgi:hypothetical protein
VTLLLHYLTRNKDAIVTRWLDITLAGYEADRIHFLKHEQDRFRNPVGFAFRENLPLLYDALLLGRPCSEVAAELDMLMRLRAVQNFDPAQAVSFVFLLKEMVGEAILRNPQVGADASALADFGDRVDGLAHYASSLYAACRKQICRIKANEARRRTFVLERARPSGRAIEAPVNLDTSEKSTGDISLFQADITGESS